MKHQQDKKEGNKLANKFENPHYEYLLFSMDKAKGVWTYAQGSTL